MSIKNTAHLWVINNFVVLMKWFDVNLAIAPFVNNYFDDTACLHICMCKQTLQKAS